MREYTSLALFPAFLSKRGLSRLIIVLTEKVEFRLGKTEKVEIIKDNIAWFVHKSMKHPRVLIGDVKG
jgi:hypothetical protein